MFSNNIFRIGFVFGLLVAFIGLSVAPSIGEIIEENKVIKLITSEINGLYYLRDDDPFNYQDKGSLLKNAPLENVVTCCGMFVLFPFAEEAIYVETYTVFNIYYHICPKVPETPIEGELFELG